MTAKAKRSKKNTAYSTHEYLVTYLTPTGDKTGDVTVVGSREAFHRQTEQEGLGYLVAVRNLTTGTEEYRSPALKAEWGFELAETPSEKIVDAAPAI